MVSEKLLNQKVAYAEKALSIVEEEVFHDDLLSNRTDFTYKQKVSNNYTENYEQCEFESQDGHQIVTDYGGSLVWSHNEQNIVFSGTFWGALVVCLPAMVIVQRRSPRLIFLTAMMLYIISSLSTPFLANHFGFKAVFLSRALMGLGEGVVIPCINALISNWFPVEERSTAIALFTTGNQLAGAIGNPVAAILCASKWKWPAIFYACALLGGIWSVLWTFASSDDPSKCNVMTQREREYLAEKVVTTHRKTQNKRNIPYKKVLTSLPFLAQFQSGMVIHIIIAFLHIYLATYLKDVLRLGVVANGAFIAIPNIFTFLFQVGWGMSMDKLKGNNIISPTTAVKISQSCANLGLGVGLLSLAFFVDCSTPGLALVVFCIMYAMMSTFTSGVYTSLLSLAPPFTATLSSISMFGNLLGRLSTPFIVGMLKHSGTEAEWRTIFCLFASFSLISGLIFAVFASGEVQEWGREASESEDGSRNATRESGHELNITT